MATDRTGFIHVALVAHEPLKALQTSLVVHMRAAQDSLLVKLQVLKANRAGLFLNL